jgi:glycosyltransferase involved in cell wall biosynthesis
MPQSRSVLYVGTLPPHPGGSAISCAQLLVEFVKAGHAVHALAPMTADAFRSGDPFAARHPEIGLTRFFLPYFESSVEIPAPEEYRKLEHDQIQEKLKILIGNGRPDVIFLGRESFAWHVPDIAQACSVPCILRTAGSATTMGILKGTYPEPLAQQLLQQYRKVDLIVTPAEHMAESLRQLDFKNIRSIPNAVDIRQFYPRPKNQALLRELGIREDAIVVAHAANLRPLKRPLDLVHSAEKALQKNSRLVYLIVGDGDLRSAVEKTCKAKNLDGKFRFVGWIDYDRMPDYINLADIVVMASEAEGLARVYLETQACGRLLLASNIPAAREVIAHGATGLLFRLGDTDDLTAKTLLAAGDANLRAEIGRKARQQAERRSLDRVAAEYIAAFEAVLQ